MADFELRIHPSMSTQLLTMNVWQDGAVVASDDTDNGVSVAQLGGEWFASATFDLSAATVAGAIETTVVNQYGEVGNIELGAVDDSGNLVSDSTNAELEIKVDALQEEVEHCRRADQKLARGEGVQRSKDPAHGGSWIDKDNIVEALRKVTP